MLYPFSHFNWFDLYTAAEWVIRVVMFFVVLRRRMRPVTSLAWLSAIFFLPFVGLPVYLLLGVSYLGNRRKVESHRRVLHERARQPPDPVAEHVEHPDVAPEHENMIRQAEHVSGNPIVGGSNLELLGNTEAYINRLAADVDAAEHHVHLLYYLYRPDTMGERITHALIRAAGRGVDCRLLVDTAGSRMLLRTNVPQRLRDAGVHVHAALPVSLWRRRIARIDVRNHRKIAVIDGHIAYTGSHNLVVQTYGNAWAGQWIDLSGRFTGPVVAQIQKVFLDDWAFETDESLEDEAFYPPLARVGRIAAQVVPTGPSHESETFRRLLLAALNSAREQITMTTPYLIPDEPSLLALRMAADRGVDVHIIVPRRSDSPLVNAASRWYFLNLLEAGVTLHHYRGGMLHAKTITVDDSFALLGSANLDVRSFELNFEINVVLYGPAVTAQLRSAQNGYLRDCDPVNLDQWRQRSAIKRYADSAAALLSPLL